MKMKLTYTFQYEAGCRIQSALVNELDRALRNAWPNEEIEVGTSNEEGHMLRAPNGLIAAEAMLIIHNVLEFGDYREEDCNCDACSGNPFIARDDDDLPDGGEDKCF
jgi:hypothetical protein